MPVKDPNRASLLSTINAATFGIDDIMLYLDTHPHDTAALARYQEYRTMRREAAERYICQYGPLTKEDVTAESVWTWVNEPWPWEGEVC